METAANPSVEFQKYFQLEKFDAFQGIATGIATSETKDRDNEILDYAKSKPYFEAWSDSVHKDSGGKSFGNVRLQHDDKKVAGRLNAIEFNDDAKMIRVEAKIVDPVAKELLETGCLTGFSIGGRYVDKSKDVDGTVRYVADPCEISVVDRPALPEAVFQSVKADGTIELKKFAKYEGEPKEVVAPKVEPAKADDVDKAIALQIDLADTVDIIKNLDIEKSSVEILALLDTLEKELEIKMADEKKPEVITLDKAARHSIQQKIMAAKAHLTDHLGKCTKAVEMAHGHLDGIAKVMGGGPESIDEDGKPNELSHEDPHKVPQVPGGSDTADKGFKFVEVMDKDNKPTGLFKKVSVNPEPITKEDIQKTVIETMLALQKTATESVGAIGDRANVTPFRKADAVTKDADGKPVEKQNDGPAPMTPDDWKAYSEGDPKAIRKAQSATALKWQPQPSRFANHDRQRAAV